ncbi:MAG: CPBP family intramembrane metalloprotease [Anaerolineae bacterium]|nr:CPBP family intramembrane metalloprotease [Anaerolineae bacterium]
MEQLLIYLPFLALVVVANVAERHRVAPYRVADPQLDELARAVIRYAPEALLTLVNVSLMGLGIIAALAGQVGLLTAAPGAEGTLLDVNWVGAAGTMFLTGALAFLPLLRPVRAWLARWLDIDPDSDMHMTALAFAAYQIGLSLSQLALIGNIETLAATDLVLDEWDVLLSGVPLFVFALLGVGLWIRRTGSGTAQRLGLVRPTWRQIFAVPILIILFIAIDYAVAEAWSALDPAGYALLEGFTAKLYGSLATATGALVLGLSAGISEEILFRGAVQPRLGLLLATTLFAIGHIQYGVTPATAEVFFIGLILGLVRARTNTTMAILVHAGYNAIGTLIEMF